MTSFLTIIACPAVQNITEKSLFGKPYVRIGRLFVALGYWVYQQGGLLGYALRDNPKLLAKLVAPPGASLEQAIKELYDSETVASELEEVKHEDKTFFHLYTLRELRSIGIELTSWPPDKNLEKKADVEFVGAVMRISFIKGVLLGFNFPNIFITYWENTYKVRANSEWKEMYRRGIAQSEVQPRLTLEEAIAELAQAAIAWSTEETSGRLNDNDIETLQQLATVNKESQDNRRGTGTT